MTTNDLISIVVAKLQGDLNIFYLKNTACNDYNRGLIDGYEKGINHAIEILEGYYEQPK